jgi:hypothetical protein
MNDRVIAARLGFGTTAVHEAVENAKRASRSDEKIAYLTEALEILLAHFDHVESEKELNEMNRQLGNI